MDDLGWPSLVDHWAKRCATRRGEAAVRGEILLPAIDGARTRAAEIREARTLASLDHRLPLGHIADIAGAIDRVKKSAALDAAELVAVAATGRAFERLRVHLREHAAHAPRLAASGARLADLGHVFHPILDAFDPEGRLVDHASDDLGPLRKAAATIKHTLEKRMETLLTDERFSAYLQDQYYTQREDRYVLPVRTDGKGFVKGIVHGSSQSGQTMFIEPEEIVDLNNRLKLAEAEVLAEERRIFIKFSGWIAEEAIGFTVSAAICEQLDVIAAAAIMADDTVSAEPILDEAPRIALLHARHPLMLLGDRRCVANDVTVAARQTLLISGPNAGGKTVALKTVGLAALMARAGLHLTCESGSVIGWFHDIVTDIGDAQNLEKDLSTFSGHIVNLRDLLTSAAPGLLVLIDEIAVGTDPDQGASLAQAVLEELAAGVEDARDGYRPTVRECIGRLRHGEARAYVQAPPRLARQLRRPRGRDADGAREGRRGACARARRRAGCEDRRSAGERRGSAPPDRAGACAVTRGARAGRSGSSLDPARPRPIQRALRQAAARGTR
jgi:DNA mismatch repair protein MutS2